MIKQMSLRTVILGLVMLVATFLIGAQELLPQQVDAIESRRVNIYSDGTRLSGDLFYPKGSKAGDNLPVIILCHGWGGLRAHLNRDYAPAFAKSGYAVLTFDYRGWGDSDNRLIINGPMPKPDANGEVIVHARPVREIVDPRDQIEDVTSAIYFVSGEPMVNPERIGLWGSSLGGGHVVYVAATDGRVKCIVSQVGAMHHRGISKQRVNKQAIARARGEIDQVPPDADKVKGLNGTPNYVRMAYFHPIDLADRLKIPVLIIDAEKEELMKTNEHGQYLYGLLKDRVPVRYEILPGTHFEIYTKSRMAATKLAIEWFNQYLKGK